MSAAPSGAPSGLPNMTFQVPPVVPEGGSEPVPMSELNDASPPKLSQNEIMELGSKIDLSKYSESEIGIAKEIHGFFLEKYGPEKAGSMMKLLKNQVKKLANQESVSNSQPSTKEIIQTSVQLQDFLKMAGNPSLTPEQHEKLIEMFSFKPPGQENTAATYLHSIVVQSSGTKRKDFSSSSSSSSVSSFAPLVNMKTLPPGKKAHVDPSHELNATTLANAIRDLYED